MQLAHLGLLVMVAGVALTTAYSIERDVRLSPGVSVEVEGHRFAWTGVQHVEGPNYSAERGEVKLYRGDTLVETLHPEKRRYNVSGQVMTEAAIDPGLFRDIYVAMGEPLEGDAWAVRVYYKPFIRWTWLGALIMVFGGMVSMSDRRYRMGARAAQAAPAAGEKA